MAKRRFAESAGVARGAFDAERQQNQLAQDSTRSTVVPRSDAPAEDWADYVNDARGKAVEAVVEWGRRIQLAHEAHRAQGQRWGRTWEDWCRQNLGISDEYARNLMQAAQNLPTNSWGVLPPATSKLLAIAKLEPEKIDRALAQGLIHPDISMQEIKGLKTIDVQVVAVEELSEVPAKKAISLPVELVQRIKANAKDQGQTPAEFLENLLSTWSKTL